MKPYYALEEDTAKTVLELIEKCQALNLGNVSFSYYGDEIDFYISEHKQYWELVVKQKRKNIDIYRIAGNIMQYQYSEIRVSASPFNRNWCQGWGNTWVMLGLGKFREKNYHDRTYIKPAE
jgi:hypothetical protein